MPIIAGHHRRKSRNSTDNDYQPACAWPDDCYVQWGGGGVVLSEKGSYRTAFFEASPKGPGFFRGEGETIAAAEAECFEKWSRFSVCDHQWGRGFKVESRSTEVRNGQERPKLRGRTHYTNGGAICRKCGAFGSVFKEIVKLGGWREPPSIHALTMAAEGSLRPIGHPREDAGMRKHARRTELRLRLAGVALPETPDTPSPFGLLDDPNDDPYQVACRKAVVDWYLERKPEFERDGSFSMGGLFDALEHRSLERLVEAEAAYRARRDDPGAEGAP